MLNDLRSSGPDMELACRAARSEASAQRLQPQWPRRARPDSFRPRHREVPRAMRVKRVQHVSIGIEAGREGEARKFYGEILGLREKKRPAGLKHMALIWYDVGDDEDEIHLICTDPARFGGQRPGDHLCIEVDDLAAFRDR